MKPSPFYVLALLFAIFVHDSHQKSSVESNSYVAAVVEFSPDEPTSPDEPPNKKNAARYISFIDQAAKQNVDIIVFPEVGLTSILEPDRPKLDPWTTIVPDASDHYIPCIHATIPVSETMKVISCSARDRMIYVVINVAEKVVCTNESCPSDQRLYYNTNVVFDREGKIIARYRKTHLFIEPGFNVTAVPEVVTFQTDFGVTFGTFICFDTLFKKPAMYLTRVLNVTDIVFPTAWFSEIPFLTALQTQAGWSYAEDVNFLVSGYNRPEFGNSGSGIYLGREGIAEAIIPGSRTSQMLVAKVPKKNESSRRVRPSYRYNYLEETTVRENNLHDEFRRKRRWNSGESSSSENEKKKERTNKRVSLLREDLSSYRSLRFDSSLSKDLCHGNFCCSFNIELEASPQDEKVYRMLVFNGTRTFGVPVVAGLYVCAIVLCSNDSIASCGHPAKTDIVFKLLSINMTFPNYENVLVMPSSIDSDLQPLANWGYQQQWRNKELTVHANLDGATGDIVTCGIYARDFSRDTLADTDDWKIHMQWATLAALAIVSIFLLFLYRKGWRKPWQRDNQSASEAAGPYQRVPTR